jgi:flagella basal body P-ring formation protein FlgA
MSLLFSLAILVAAVCAPRAPAVATELVLAPGEPLTGAHVDRMVAPELPPAPAETRTEIEWLVPRLPLDNPATVPTRLWLMEVHTDDASGRITAIVDARLETGESSRLRLVGEVRRLRPVAVPRSTVPRGMVLDGPMFETVWFPEARLPADAVTDPSELEGRETRRRLAAGRPVSRADLAEPRLVRRGETVTAVYVVPGLELVGLATALEDGTLGDPVRLVNPESRRTFRGFVVGPRRVKVGGSLP